jgi:hypothetical protein
VNKNARGFLMSTPNETESGKIDPSPVEKAMHAAEIVAKSLPDCGEVSVTVEGVTITLKRLKDENNQSGNVPAVA